VVTVECDPARAGRRHVSYRAVGRGGESARCCASPNGSPTGRTISRSSARGCTCTT